MKAPLPHNEDARLSALQQYHVLDTAPETAFDELTQLAAQICQTSMASLTFVDQSRQWHKSAFGMELGEADRDVSFCSHTVERGDLLVVPDALQDARFQDNPLVTADEGIRFYAGMPLITPEGLSVGSLCVLDTVPHEIGPEQLQALRVLGRQAVAQLELRPGVAEIPNDAATPSESEVLNAPQSRQQRLQQRRQERSQAAETLRRADERDRDLFEAIREGILIVDAASGIIEESSPFLSEITGAAPLTRRRLWRVAALQPLFPSESKWALVRQALRETGDVYVPEIALTAPNGSPLWIEFRAHLYEHEGREMVRAHLRDMTQSKLDRDALRAQEQHSAMLLKLSLSAIVMMDENGAITEWNPAAETMFGTERAQVIGKDLAEIIVPPALRSTYRDTLVRHLRTGESHILGRCAEFSALRADGSEFPIELTIARFESENGPNFMASLRDITDHKNAQLAMQLAQNDLERRVVERTAELSETNAELQLKIADLQRAEERLAASAHRLRGVLESINDAFVALDAQWRFTYVNDQAQRLMNRPCEELLSRDVDEGFPGVRGIICKDHYQAIVDCGQPIKREVYYTPWKIWLEIHAYPSEDGLSIYFQDISARRADQFALEQAKREADAANAAKSEFLGRISHELRTPLNAILGFGQLLDKQDLSPSQQEGVGYILKSGAHLLGLINEVLDITRVEAGQSELHIEAIALEQAIADASAIVRPLANARAIRLILPTPGETEKTGAPAVAAPYYVQADRQRLAQILINLLSNAIKYNFDNGEIEVTCRADDLGKVMIGVRDSGPGIATESLPRLFVPFERGAAANSGIEGTGLGLALTRSLVEAMGGEVSVESALGRGSTFSFDLPVALAPTMPIANVIAPAQPAREFAEAACTYRVLCIEDNASNLRLIELLLATRPEISLISAQSGAAGFELATQHEPDLILLDLNLPDAHGSQILRQLQETSTTRDIPVVIVSADATATQIEKLLDGGASEYLTKPLDMRRLLQVLDRILQPITE